ncbi:NAD(P)/FAD-dependent oxidoreductase [Marinimicrobium sp. ABcell2]|uniref:NAD(P)/FAD-dependent oxidoreductase n=1 Tax=Marinimicrobium sp. ABcell2 TaxID=3069751 RepID=UPI0027B812CB|nr:FAD-dependent oxidoreductase [Marinimicrobium sp. ABcell2]MDQ2076800.1 FAD-dependent oxidoreductase [Marinimicrobium sp. ABcell2]
MKIAIIGSGISGLTAAYQLNRRHAVTVFESAERIGGHTATIDFELDGRQYAVDTGFIVYNEWTYPNFIQLLEELNVATQPTHMGFSVSCETSGVEYAGDNLNTLFAQRGNIFSTSHWRMLRDIMRFNKKAQEDLEHNRIPEHMTLGDYLARENYSQAFCQRYLIPMGAAIWSTSCAQMEQFPLQFFVRFFSNHGLLNVVNRPTWRVISGGSANYLKPLAASFKDRIRLNTTIVSINRGANCVRLLMQDGTTETYDGVLLATHSDQALALLNDPSPEECAVLGAIQYQDNSVVLHWDESLLPKNRRTWSSWNYRLGKDAQALPTLTYNMNILQGIESDKTFCVTLNDDSRIDPAKIIGRYTYAHPQFSLEAEAAKQRWADINGVNNTWYCGAYWANGFHEDGVTSAQRAAEMIDRDPLSSQVRKSTLSASLAI